MKSVNMGIDVSKEKLSVYIPAAKEGARPVSVEVNNSVEGFKQIRVFARKAKATVCVEPTGGYELDLIAFMLKSNVAVAYADAFRVRKFAQAEGNLSKNDTIDAALISRFADAIGVRLLEQKDINAVELKRKAKFRQTMMDMRTILINRLETETDSEMKDLFKKQIKHLEKIIAKMEKSCLESISKNERMSSIHQRFIQVSGIGNVTTIAILSNLPEIGTLSDEKLYRLAGLAPKEDKSGTKEKCNKIWGGRKDARNALYMATTASLQWNVILGTYYRKKRAEGRQHKWAMIPTMRKLLSLLNRIARDPTFVPKPEPESTKKNANAGRKKKAA